MAENKDVPQGNNGTDVGPYRLNVQFQLEPTIKSELPITEGLFKLETGEHLVDRTHIKKPNPKKPGKRILDQTSGVSLARLMGSLTGYTYVGGGMELRNKGTPHAMLVVKLNYVRSDMVSGQPIKPDETVLKAKQLYFQHHKAAIQAECEQLFQSEVGTAWAYLNDANDMALQKVIAIVLDGKQDEKPRKYLTVQGEKIVLA